MDRTERLRLSEVTADWDRGTRPPLWRLDWTLLLVAAALSAIGVTAVFAATAPRLAAAGVPVWTSAARHAALAAVGMGLAIAVIAVDYRRWRPATGVLWLLGVALLVAVWSPLGQAAQGAQRWIQIGGVALQPAELAKLAVILAGAACLARCGGRPRARNLLLVGLLAAIPAGLVVAQPDLGTAIVLLWLAAVLLVAGRTPLRWLVGLAITGIVGLVVATGGNYGQHNG
jgi:rod shape determining protein RodA